jgi:hypothetical protein
MSDGKLTMKFDPQTIEHLGIQMYYTLPPVIAELVSNSYDADAKKVHVYLNDNSVKSIIIQDDGHGMTFDEINSNFLKIGRNRRIHTGQQVSESGKRHVIGKKGIGKLSFFGIAHEIVVDTVKKNVRNIFKLDWEVLVNSRDNYEPEILEKDIPTSEKNGTKITLTKITRKTGFDPGNIAYNLSKTFTIFDEKDFETVIIHNNDFANKLVVTNELKYEGIDAEFEWNFPLDNGIEVKYDYSKRITGKVISSKNTVPSKINGITLFSRGKLVNDPEFYSDKASSFGYSYLTGWLNVDFIDEWKKDVISTNRKSLNWEEEETAELKKYLNAVVKYIYKEQRLKRKAKQVELISKIANVNIEEWQRMLPKHEGKLAKKLIDAILSSDGLPTEKQAELVKFVKDSFQFESFKNFAKDLGDVNDLDPVKLLDLFKEWEFIEAREMFKLATGRIQTIKTFQSLINQNALEVKEIHPFFEKFPWILDPRINMFRHEAQYVQLLKENYHEVDTEDINRRIDFLCTSVANNRFVIEIKRPLHRISKKDIEQAKDYRNFIQDRCNTDPLSPNKVVAYLVGGYISDDRLTREEIENQQKLDLVYVKTFTQLLTDAANYHLEFIEKYNELESRK